MAWRGRGMAWHGRSMVWHGMMGHGMVGVLYGMTG